MPWFSTVPLRVADPPSGWITNQAAPALFAPFTVTAESSAPYRTPRANETCCMRESLLGSAVMCSGNGPAGGGTTMLRQHPTPSGVEIVPSARHWPSGKSPAFCVEAGGTAYSCVFTVVAVSFTFGEEVLRDEVFETSHSTSSSNAPS